MMEQATARLCRSHGPDVSMDHDSYPFACDSIVGGLHAYYTT